MRSSHPGFCRPEAFNRLCVPSTDDQSSLNCSGTCGGSLTEVVRALVGSNARFRAPARAHTRVCLSARRDRAAACSGPFSAVHWLLQPRLAGADGAPRHKHPIQQTSTFYTLGNQAMQVFRVDRHQHPHRFRCSSSDGEHPSIWSTEGWHGPEMPASASSVFSSLDDDGRKCRQGLPAQTFCQKAMSVQS